MASRSDSRKKWPSVSTLLVAVILASGCRETTACNIRSETVQVSYGPGLAGQARLDALIADGWDCNTVTYNPATKTSFASETRTCLKCL